MARRLVIGQQNDGSFGLRAVLPGYDAFSGDGSGGEFTFNSAWTDITQIHQVGIASWQNGFTYEATTASGTIGPSGVQGYKVVFPALGYYPFVEMRKVVGGTTVYDDYCTPGQVAGFQSGGIRSTYWFMISNNITGGGWDAGWQMLYVVFKVAIPVPVYP